MFADGTFGGLLLRLAMSDEGEVEEGRGVGSSVVTLRRCLGHKNSGFRFFCERLEECLGEMGSWAEGLIFWWGKKGGVVMALVLYDICFMLFLSPFYLGLCHLLADELWKIREGNKIHSQHVRPYDRP